ncbi:NlpC/P60 family protein [Antribacter gilvus]|uniref:NlpC/P60 family protein n=1 Tax=Antribacter gilvus TaxID=2304675 RepID=UPI000F7B6C57|nr:NlpC/P60 family protein [Antribacter gilvus]
MEHDWQRYIDNAVAWAHAALGSTAYTTRCLAFVEDAYERSNEVEVFGGDSARESAELYAAHESSGEPPRGAFVFYDNTGELLGTRQNWGHVGLSLGDGLVIHAWDRVRLDSYLAVQDLAGPPGWDSPRLVGWTPVERIFEGSRPRVWVGDAAEAAERMARERFGEAKR